MKRGSSIPTSDKFRFNIFLDTNILVFLIDETYPTLNKFIDLAAQSEFCNLVSSNFVLFEFVGIRKREHYLRKVVSFTKKAKNGEINFSSLLKISKIDSFKAREVEFTDIVGDIKETVKLEIDELIKKNISFDYSNIHNDQLTPVLEICLSSKISNQDSMVLISSALPSSKKSNNNVLLFTSDKDFFNYCQDDLDPILSPFNIYKPEVIHLETHSKFKKFDLCKDIEAPKLVELFNNFLLDRIVENNKEYYLGKIITPRSTEIPKNVICFKLNIGVKLPNNIYLTIFDPNLVFIYNSNNIIKYFLHNGNSLDANYVSACKDNVSFELPELNDCEQDIYDSIKKEGNLIFVHPDNQTA